MHPFYGFADKQEGHHPSTAEKTWPGNMKGVINRPEHRDGLIMG
jgi:hypothetical protein